MTDKETLINNMMLCLGEGVDNPDPCNYCAYSAKGACVRAMMSDALSLLREQGSEIIRCKDCKHYNPDIQTCHNGVDGILLPDWFCADGERR